LSAYYAALNRNKSNICVDLKNAAGQSILLKLLETADVVVENFRAGTMTAWGLDYETELRARFPRLIYCRITGFGTDGPMGGLPGYDATVQAYSGLMSVNGEADGDPVRIGVPLVDLHTAVQSFSGILLALVERGVSGQGQLVETTLLDSAVNLLHPHSATWLATGELPKRTGSAHPVIAPYDAFRTSRGLFFVSAGNNQQFGQLGEALGRPDLGADPRFVDNQARVRNVVELSELLSRLLSEKDPELLAADLLKRGVPAAPIRTVADALQSAQVRHRGMVVEQDGYRGVGIPVTMSRTPGSVRQAPRDKGADTTAVLTDLGYDESQIAAFLAGGAASQA
jgi:crotonobetainyl-CoA:carnitine CoA-transferase CaiB-like acyl-CoA transferase